MHISIINKNSNNIYATNDGELCCLVVYGNFFSNLFHGGRMFGRLAEYFRMGLTAFEPWCMEPTQGKYQNMLLNFPKTWLEILEDNSENRRGILYKYCSGYLGNFWLLSENGCRYDRALFWVPCTHLPSIQHKFFRPWLLWFLYYFENLS